MAVLFFDGFEWANGATGSGLKYSDVYGINTTVPNTGRFGGLAMITNSEAKRNIPAGATWSGPDFSFCAAFKRNVSLSNNNQPLFRLYQAAAQTTGQITLSGDADGTLRVSRGSTAGTNVIASSAAGVLNQDGSFHYVEFTFNLHASTGSATVKVDGITVISATGLNSKGGTTTAIASFGLGSTDYNTLDDFYVTDGASLGERRIVACRPSADTATADWTPNSGSPHFSRVNETAADGDTTYVSSSTVGHKDLYDCDNLPTSPTTIDGVRIISAARKDDAATRTYRQLLKSSSTTANGADVGVNSSYTMAESQFLTDPATSAAWTASGVNAMQIGIELRA